MRRSTSLTALASAGLLSGFALTAISPAATAAGAGQESLTVDKAIVHAGNQLTLRLSHGPESMSWISSPAFVRTGEHPVGADEGLARVISDRDGNASAIATVGNVAPGSYVVHTRVGGGCGPTATIRVIR
jgi:hypothetical protein